MYVAARHLVIDELSAYYASYDYQASYKVPSRIDYLMITSNTLPG